MTVSQLKYSYLIFVLLYLLFIVVGRIGSLPLYEQVSMLGMGLLSFLYIFQKRILFSCPINVFINTLLFQFICALILKSEFYLFAETIHGPSADDGILYFEYAQKGANMSAEAFKNYFYDTQWNNIDDYGFLFYLRAIFMLFPGFMVPFVLLFLNALFVAIGAVALLKTMLLFDSSNEENAEIATAIFSSFLFFVNSSAVGLKEDLFVPIICMSIYHMTSFYKERRLSDILWLFFWIALTVFFRLSITLILLLIFVIGLVSSESNKRMIAYGFIIAVIASPIIIDFILTRFLGLSLETVLQVANARYGQTDADSATKKIGDMIAAFVGPFPNYSSPNDSIFYSYSSLMKMMLNLPVLMAVIHIFRNKVFDYYYLACFFVIGIMMTVVSGTGLDLRYHIPFFVSFIILLYYFMNNMEMSKKIGLPYLACCIVLVVAYNILK